MLAPNAEKGSSFRESIVCVVVVKAAWLAMILVIVHSARLDLY